MQAEIDLVNEVHISHITVQLALDKLI